MTLLERDREKIEEGREEGRKEGIKEGIEKGIKKGIKEGKEEKSLEIAKNMKALGIDIDTIIKATGLSKEEVAKI